MRKAYLRSPRKLPWGLTEESGVSRKKGRNRKMHFRRSYFLKTFRKAGKEVQQGAQMESGNKETARQGIFESGGKWARKE